MRFFVEVTSIGNAQPDTICVEADSWQRALQLARTLRGDEGTISGFSVELRDDGCRAIDPISHLHFDVRRAPDNTPLGGLKLSAQPVKSPATALAVPPPTAALRPPPPRMDGPSASISAQAGASLPPVAPGTETRPPPRTDGPSGLVSGSASAPLPPVAAALEAPLPPVAVTKAAATEPSSLRPAAPKNAITSQRPISVPAPVPVAPRPANVSADPTANTPHTGPRPAQAQGTSILAPTAKTGFDSNRAHNTSFDVSPTSTVTTELQLLYKREESPTSATPIAYREYVYALNPGTSEEMAAAVLRTQFEVIKASMTSLPMGKLLNIAAFDTVNGSKPKGLPLATLAWKDWRGEPIVAYPRRVVAPPAEPDRPSLPVVSRRPPSPPPMPSAASTAPIVLPPPQPVPVVEQISAQPDPVTPPLVGPLASPAPPAFPTATVDASAVVPPTEVEPAHAQVAAPRPPQASAPRFRNPNRSEPRMTAGRSAGDDLITDLFEAMHELHFLSNALEGADFCLALTLEKLPSRAAFVHFYDVNKREFVLASARGKGANALLLDRHSESDPMLLAAMKKRRAVVVPDASGSDAESLGRFAAIAGVRSLIVAPVMQAGRWLGAIEVLNPLDGAPFTDGDGEALSYIGEQFAEFLSSRGVILDAEQIARAGAEAARAH
jgi:putative methionine-R-sulfoxide reductase with GAF domain